MLVVGLTGGIASGKSTITKELRSFNIPVYDADEESRLAVAKGSPALEQVAETFGKEYLTAEGELNRPKVAELVFNDKEALKKLERIIHTVVWAKAEQFMAACKERQEKLCVLDVPILIETGWYKQVDEVWLVVVSKEQQIQRAMLRSGMTREEVEARINAQMSLEDKKAYAQRIIDNSGSLEETLVQVHGLLKSLGFKVE